MVDHQQTGGAGQFAEVHLRVEPLPAKVMLERIYPTWLNMERNLERAGGFVCSLTGGGAMAVAAAAPGRRHTARLSRPNTASTTSPISRGTLTSSSWLWNDCSPMR